MSSPVFNPRYFPPGHTPARWRFNHGCRCDGCVQANREYMAGLFADLASRDRSEVPHGTVGGYNNWKCRCVDCSTAHALKIKAGTADRKARLAADPTVVEHGRVATYKGWGCRCAACKEAQRVYDAARRPIRPEPPT